MKKLLSIAIFLFISLPLFAQQEEMKVADESINKVDSMRQEKLSVVDSAQLHLNNGTQKVESLKGKVVSKLSLDSIPKPKQTVTDSIADVKAKLHSKIDSLKAKNLPTAKYTQKLDSLNAIDPLAKVKDASSDVQGKISGAEQKIEGIQNNGVGGVNEKLNQLSSESMGKGTLPDQVSGQNIDLPTDNVNVNADIPGIDKPNIDVNNPVDGDILNPDLKIPEVRKPEELNQLSEVHQKVSTNTAEVSGRVSGYAADAKNIGSGNIDDVKTLKEDGLKQAGLNEEMGALKEQEALIAEQKELLNSMKNHEKYKEQTLARGKELMAKQLARHSKVIQQGVDKVNKSQRTAGTILNKKKDLPKRRDPLRKLKFYEKFVPGINLQAYKTDAWLVDVNPSLRYRLTSYWSVGSGWNERVIIGESSRPDEKLRVYGLRTYSEVIIFKGLAMRLDVDHMNAFIAPNYQQQDVGSRRWVWNYMAGLKKEFSFVKRVTGNVQFMYNLYDPDNYRMYPSRFNVRFGFEYSLKRRKKSSAKSKSDIKPSKDK